MFDRLRDIIEKKMDEQRKLKEYEQNLENEAKKKFIEDKVKAKYDKKRKHL